MKKILWMIVAILMVASSGSTEDLKEAARAIAAKFQKAIITVKIVAKVRTFRGEEDNQMELRGTVIDPSGLTVVSAISADPAEMIKTLVSSMSQRQMPAGAKFESEITSVMMILDDGTEVEGEVVLKDADLDLAFIRPKKKSASFDFVPLKPRGKFLDLLDDVIVINRLDRSQNRAIALNIGSIQAVVKGPRPYYISTQQVSASSVGCVAFASDGGTAGIFVTQRKQNTGDNGMSALISIMMGSGVGGAGTFQILRPVEDVLEVAKQAQQEE
jgi:hypothetical protein